MARRDPHQRIVTRANLLTMSRVVGASLISGTAAAPGVGHRAAILALLWGGPSDWLDGPLARRDGPTALGAWLDIEADSWLTLWAAMATYRTRVLPRISLLPPILRYAIPVLQAWRKSKRPRDRAWQRAAAGLQTVTFLFALTPRGRLQRVARAVAPFATIAQSVAMACTVRALLRTTLD